MKIVMKTLLHNIKKHLARAKYFFTQLYLIVFIEANAASPILKSPQLNPAGN